MVAVTLSQGGHLWMVLPLYADRANSFYQGPDLGNIHILVLPLLPFPIDVIPFLDRIQYTYTLTHIGEAHITQ